MMPLKKIANKEPIIKPRTKYNVLCLCFVITEFINFDHKIKPIRTPTAKIASKRTLFQPFEKSTKLKIGS